MEITLTAGEARLPAVVYRPEQPGRFPAVVVAPGGLAEGDLEEYHWAGERFAASGFVTLIHGYRAATPAGDSDDISAAVDWLRADDEVDGGRIALFGHSRGGASALIAGARDARVSAVIAIAPVTDILDYTRRMTAYMPAVGAVIAQFIGGSPEDAPARYEAMRVLNYAERIRQPVLLIHGTADMRAPLDQSLTLRAALNEAGNKHVHLEIVPGMGHYLEFATRGYQFDRITEMTTAWLATVLGEAAAR